LGQISTKKRKKFYFFMMAAVGLTATIFPMVKGVPAGKYSRVQEALTTFLRFKTKPKVDLTLEDESKIEVETMLVTIANTPLIGLKNLVAPEASMEDGLLDISVFPGFTKAMVLRYFAQTANKGAPPDGSIQRYRAKKITVRTTPKLDIAAEGILLGKGTAWIKVLPGALRVIAPEPGQGAEKPLKKSSKKLAAPLSAVSK
jgi:diacylglycerol kinase (ATP)